MEVINTEPVPGPKTHTEVLACAHGDMDQQLVRMLRKPVPKRLDIRRMKRALALVVSRRHDVLVGREHR